MNALLHSYTLNTGPGNQVILSVLNHADYSNLDAITVRVKLTKCATDTVDQLDIRLQDSWDAGTTWNDRIRLPAVAGDATASAGAPKTLQGTVQKFGTLADGEEVSEPSGSAGGSAITAATVVNGVFPGKQRIKGTNGLQPSFRLRIETTGEADADQDWEGQITVHGESLLP